MQGVAPLFKTSNVFHSSSSCVTLASLYFSSPITFSSEALSGKESFLVSKRHESKHIQTIFYILSFFSSQPNKIIFCLPLFFSPNQTYERKLNILYPFIVPSQLNKAMRIGLHVTIEVRMKYIIVRIFQSRGYLIQLQCLSQFMWVSHLMTCE